jgi:transglycosylase-like protein with SLT domain
LTDLSEVTKRRLCTDSSKLRRRVAAIVGAVLLFSCPLHMARASLDADTTTEPEQVTPPRFSSTLEGAIQQAAERYGVLESTLRAFAAIESGGRPRVSTGSYHGVFQLSYNLFRKYGGHGSIFDPKQNTEAAARKFRAEIDAFRVRFGYEPSDVELYMMHQQGSGGAAMHISQPDLPAWQNMYRTAEGQKRGEAWARRAIWGNVPTDQRARFPAGVDSITSREFMEIWARRMARFGGGDTVAAYTPG